MAREFIKIDDDKGRVEFLDSRFYQHPTTGDFYPSVTTILEAYPKSFALLEWMKKMGGDADEIRDEAGRRGSIVHQCTEDLDRGIEICFLDAFNKPRFKQIEWAMFERYVEFRTNWDFELIANEVHYISQIFGYGGTIDRVFKYQDQHWMIDIKTSNSLHPQYWLQQAAYAAMFEEYNNITIDRIAILHLNSKTRTPGGKIIQGIGWKLYEPEYSREHYFNIFQSVFSLWKEENKDIKPRNLSYKLNHKL